MSLYQPTSTALTVYTSPVVKNNTSWRDNLYARFLHMIAVADENDANLVTMLSAMNSGGKGATLSVDEGSFHKMFTCPRDYTIYKKSIINQNGRLPNKGPGEW